MHQKIIAVAPGRICLFGDHQDYLGLPVIACAINRHIQIEATPNHKNAFYINAIDIGKQRVIPININTKEAKKNDHLVSVMHVVARNGCIPKQGYDITISGTVPINAGISSSSALVVAWTKFLLEAFGANEPITPALVARLAYEAEVVEQGSPGGKMDQYSSGLGSIMYLETDDASFFEIMNTPLEGLIIGESGIPKDTLGLLSEKKRKQISAIEEVKKKKHHFSVTKASIEDLPELLNDVPPDLQPYLTAAITNYSITKEARIELKKTPLDYQKIGTLINKHNSVLKNILRITVPRIDNMIDAAIKAGAYGAKIVGSGGGGCIVALAPKENVEAVILAIKSAGAKNAYLVKVDTGARIL